MLRVKETALAPADVQQWATWARQEPDFQPLFTIVFTNSFLMFNASMKKIDDSDKQLGPNEVNEAKTRRTFPTRQATPSRSLAASFVLR
jgi:hypothetical protein